MFETLKNAFKVKEIRKKIFIMLALLLVYRIGCYIPVPGLRSSVFSEYVEDGGNNFLALMSAVTGGALANGTLFALGIGPYINASIIMQLLAVGIPALERLSKQGEEGKKKIATYTRILTLVLAIVQAIGVIINFASTRNAINFTYFWDQEWLTYIYMAVVYTGGAMITMWLGERITEYGVGNGISMIIFIGIISTAGNQLIIAPIQNTVESGFSASTLVSTIVFIVIAIVIFALIVLVDLAERRIPVQYAKQVKGRKMYGGQATVIPIKISGSGVMPLIFAFAIISLPDLFMGLFWDGYSSSWYAQNISGGTGPWAWVYILVLCLLIFAFSFFYAQIQFNPEDISKSIQQNGGFIPGIRPGKPTADYLKKISNRITLFGAIFLSLVAFVPSFAFSFAGAGYVNVFSTTGILIIVSVALEFDKQLQSQLMMKNYKGFLK
ncbi:MAG TPA: preprotein translocase subunit SecY [Candidatus Borkfalkia excrementavium]|uniref:Protein translocase subunit SecY n=1 Tax=Candidatus Borkfalkia excrementavium TaxID=2838505 RepID=A0A9D2CGI3_9FIRM|nr:preprotein translocase subunit SecY [Candidatus Borkfalkia excrementavium]